MTNEPALETDAMLAIGPPSDWPAFACALEIQRNAARADAARLRTALEGMLIAEMELRQMVGLSADEAETEPHWMAARAALAERDRLKADITGDIAAMTLSLTAERNALRADAARLRDVLQRIVSNGGSATNEMLFDARTALTK
jgi:hypothetical protein